MTSTEWFWGALSLLCWAGGWQERGRSWVRPESFSSCLSQGLLSQYALICNDYKRLVIDIWNTAWITVSGFSISGVGTARVLGILQEHPWFHWPIMRARVVLDTAEPPKCFAMTNGAVLPLLCSNCGNCTLMWDNDTALMLAKLCAAELYTNACVENDLGQTRKKLKSCWLLPQRSSSGSTSPHCAVICAHEFITREGLLC